MSCLLSQPRSFLLQSPHFIRLAKEAYEPDLENAGENGRGPKQPAPSYGL